MICNRCKKEQSMLPHVQADTHAKVALKDIDTLMQASEFPQALSECRKLQKRLQTCFGPGHKHRVWVLKRMFRIHRAMGQYEDACRYAEERLSWQQQVFCCDDRAEPVVAHSLIELGECVAQAGRSKSQAVELIRRGTEMLRVCFGQDHPTCIAVEARANAIIRCSTRGKRKRC